MNTETKTRSEQRSEGLNAFYIEHAPHANIEAGSIYTDLFDAAEEIFHEYAEGELSSFDSIDTRAAEYASGSYHYYTECRSLYFELRDTPTGEAIAFEFSHQEYEDLDDYFVAFVQLTVRDIVRLLAERAAEAWDMLDAVERESIAPHVCVHAESVTPALGTRYCGGCDDIYEATPEEEDADE